MASKHAELLPLKRLHLYDHKVKDSIRLRWIFLLRLWIKDEIFFHIFCNSSRSGILVKKYNWLFEWVWPWVTTLLPLGWCISGHQSQSAAFIPPLHPLRSSSWPPACHFQPPSFCPDNLSSMCLTILFRPLWLHHQSIKRALIGSDLILPICSQSEAQFECLLLCCSTQARQHHYSLFSVFVLNRKRCAALNSSLCCMFFFF